MDVSTKYRTKPEQVTAIQFIGWTDFNHLHDWCRDVYFVPEGYEHSLRTSSESDPSNGHTLSNAPSFAVLRDAEVVEADGSTNRRKYVRVNSGDWVVQVRMGVYTKVHPDDFERFYEPVTPNDDQHVSGP